MIPGGLVLSSKPLGFNFARLNPASGISRIFSRDGLVDLGKLAVLAGALGAAAFWFASSHFDRSAALAAMPLSAALELTRTQITSGLAVLVALLATVATMDVPLQWYRHRRNLRMTHQEAREEMRQTEGDPLVRGRLRARQREIARSRMLAAVPSADVVMTNPTHYAVAIRYDEAGMGAPRVVAKGVDHLAARIREMAMDCGRTAVRGAAAGARSVRARRDRSRDSDRPVHRGRAGSCLRLPAAPLRSGPRPATARAAGPRRCRRNSIPRKLLNDPRLRVRRPRLVARSCSSVA